MTMSESDAPPFFILNQKICVIAGQASLRLLVEFHWQLFESCGLWPSKFYLKKRDPEKYGLLLK